MFHGASSKSLADSEMKNGSGLIYFRGQVEAQIETQNKSGRSGPNSKSCGISQIGWIKIGNMRINVPCIKESSR